MHYTFNISLINSELIFIYLDPENVEERAPGKLSLLDRAIAMANDLKHSLKEGIYNIKMIFRSGERRSRSLEKKNSSSNKR